MGGHQCILLVGPYKHSHQHTPMSDDKDNQHQRANVGMKGRVAREMEVRVAWEGVETVEAWGPAAMPSLQFVPDTRR